MARSKVSIKRRRKAAVKRKVSIRSKVSGISGEFYAVDSINPLIYVPGYVRSYSVYNYTVPNLDAYREYKQLLEEAEVVFTVLGFFNSEGLDKLYCLEQDFVEEGFITGVLIPRFVAFDSDDVVLLGKLNEVFERNSCQGCACKANYELVRDNCIGVSTKL